MSAHLGEDYVPLKAVNEKPEWSTIVPEGYRQPAKWPKGCAIIVHGQDGVEWVDAPTDHAAELAEALEYAIKQVPELETVPGIALALKAYKQSRGE